MVRYLKIFVFQFLFFIPVSAYTQTFTISGVVKDSLSSETLPYASLTFNPGGISCQANAYGQFSARVPKNNYEVTISYVGYRLLSLPVIVNSSVSLMVLLSQSARQLDEVKINDFAVVQDFVPGRSRISTDQILKQPSLGSEPDVLKSLQFLPGVKSPSESTTNISVRGGSYDQTLILLDGAPVYNTSHALGFFSTFNADAVKDVEIYKGLMPARFGNRLSSVVDIRMRDGNINKYQAKVGIGLIASRATVEGPIKKGVSSFILSGRYSYAGDVVNSLGSLARSLRLTKQIINTSNVVRFYDLTGKINFGDKAGRNRFFISAYTGHDKFNYHVLSDASLIDWGNKTASFQWNSMINHRLFMVSSASYSKYYYHYQVADDSRRFDWNANQDELNFKSEFDYSVSKAYSIQFGGQFTQNNNQPGRIDALDSVAVIRPFKLPKKYSVIGALFIENTISLGESVKISAGFRQSIFSLLGPATIYKYADSEHTIKIDSVTYPKGKSAQNYSGFEPRIGITWLLSARQSIKASYNKTVQYTHLLTNSSVGLPTDIWVPSNNFIKPQKARQITLGYYHSTPNGTYQYNIEAYYKRMAGVIDFIDNADLFVNQNVETQIRTGKGLAYGLETMVVKQTDKFRYQISYTLSKTTRKIEGISNNRSYPGRDDRRHALSFTGLYTLKKRSELTANFVFNSGAPITLPSNTFYYQGATFYSYEGRNHAKLPAYHRLDFSWIIHNKSKVHFEGSWTFSIYNVYGRKNVFTAVSKTVDFVSFKYYRITGLTPFGIVPSITYNLIIK